MAPKRRTRGGTIRATRHKVHLAERWVRPDGWLEGGLRLIGPIAYDIKDSEFPHAVTMTVWVSEGRLSCESITVTQRTGGSPVTTDGLRAATIDAYLDEIRSGLLADRSAQRHVVAPAENPFGPKAIVSDQEWEEFDRAQRPRRPMDELLPRVADAYREALRSPYAEVSKAPTAAVAKKLHYSRGHAARLVTEARKAGLLDPARPGRPGEVRTEVKRPATKANKTAKATTKASKAAGRKR
jgi:hypothetical protein